MDNSIKIGGEAGQGIQTIGDTLAKVFARAGYHIFTNQDYESRIRKGHNYFQIRFSDHPVSAPRQEIDILVALDEMSIDLHSREVKKTGQIIYDSETLNIKKNPQKEQNSSLGADYLDVPFTRLAVEHGGNKIMANTVATGTV